MERILEETRKTAEAKGGEAENDSSYGAIGVSRFGATRVKLWSAGQLTSYGHLTHMRSKWTVETLRLDTPESFLYILAINNLTKESEDGERQSLLWANFCVGVGNLGLCLGFRQKCFHNKQN